LWLILLQSTNATGEELRLARERIDALEKETQKTALETQRADIEAKDASFKEMEAKEKKARDFALKHQSKLREFGNVTIPNLKTELDNLKTERDTLTTERDTLISERDNAKAEHEKAMTEIRSQVDGLNTQLAQTRTQLEAAQRRVSQLQGDVASRDTRITTLQTEIANATKPSPQAETSPDVTAIKQELEAAQKKIVELEAQISSKQNAAAPGESEANSSVQARLQVVSSELESATQKIAELQSQLVSELEPQLESAHVYADRPQNRQRAKKQ
jgi:chromosome segregation ATPase